jgi:hypothetical protein
LPDGTRYSVTVNAESVMHAAILFYSHCYAPPMGARPPRPEMDAMLEVRPIYSVELGAAMKWANAKANRENGQKDG